MMVRPREDATLLKVVSVVEPDGTYIVLTTFSFLVTKFPHEVMPVEPI